MKKIASPQNYGINLVSFTVVRESTTPRETISAPSDVVRIGRALIPDDAREHFYLLLLNAQNALVAAHHVSTGTLNASLVHSREVFGPALRVMGVASIVLVHNHPSGDATPSSEDLRLTEQLVGGAKLLDLRIHDHVILGNGTDAWVSLAQKGQL